MTQAPATPSLVERVKEASYGAAQSYLNSTPWRGALRGDAFLAGVAWVISDPGFAALEAQQARIAELEAELADALEPSLYCEICGSCGSVGCGCEHKCKYAHSHPDVVRDMDALQALADRYEKALREAGAALSGHACHLGPGIPCARSSDQCSDECGKLAGDALMIVRQALSSSQGRHEGEAFDLLKLAEVATKAVYTHGFGFREVVGPSERDGKIYVKFAWDDDRLVRAIFFVSPNENTSPDNTNPDGEPA